VYFYKRALKLQNDVGLSARSGAAGTTRDYLYDQRLQLTLRACALQPEHTLLT
jgi:hypothetical protein